MKKKCLYVANSAFFFVIVLALMIQGFLFNLLSHKAQAFQIINLEKKETNAIVWYFFQVFCCKNKTIFFHHFHCFRLKLQVYQAYCR